MSVSSFLKALSESSGCSGYEDDVREIVKTEFAGLADEIREDKFGNVICLKKGNTTGGRKPKIMIAAHMDEIGLMVTKIEENGFIKFTNIGGIDFRVLLHQEVLIGKNRLYGIIGSRPMILQSEKDWKNSFKIDELFIDTGLPAARARQLIQIGDPITLERKFNALHADNCCGKSLDDRAGVAVMYQCLHELGKFKHEADVCLVATVQEEVGLRGAVVSSYNIYPDIGIAVDVGHGSMPGVPEEDTNDLGAGPGITMGPNIHPKIFDKLTKTAKDYNIPYQLNTAPAATGTDAWAMQITREGIPTGLLSIPLRYMHTSVEVVDLKDIINTGRLLALFIASVENEFVEGLFCF